MKEKSILIISKYPFAHKENVDSLSEQGMRAEGSR
jgi:hypothetical protein